ncbi:MAG: DUF4236 domain-containing protein [Phycisphaerales bacterium]|nr:MAG: DUF4236 domain-containing protein [Phycisphaerales bacterium]
MGLRFFRRVQVAPGIRLNLSRSGVSPSFGVRGARLTLGRSGLRTTAGLPGTGIHYTTVHKRSGSRRTTGTRKRADAARAKLHQGYFARLTTPKHERAFIDGCRACVAGREDEALAHFARADGQPDAAFMGGYLALKARKFDQAERMLRYAAEEHRRLGALARKYGVRPRAELLIIPQVRASVELGRAGAVLGLAEIHQLRGELREAIADLEKLRKLDPTCVLVRLSLAELLLEHKPDDTSSARRVVALSDGVQNESEAHAALLVFRGRALCTLGRPVLARDALTAALRRTRDRSPALLREARAERAKVYEALGNHARARADRERLRGDA